MSDNIRITKKITDDGEFFVVEHFVGDRPTRHLGTYTTNPEASAAATFHGKGLA